MSTTPAAPPAPPVAVAVSMVVDWVTYTYPAADRQAMTNAVKDTLGNAGLPGAHIGDPLLDGADLLLGLDAALRYARNAPEPVAD